METKLKLKTVGNNNTAYTTQPWAKFKKPLLFWLHIINNTINLNSYLKAQSFLRHGHQYHFNDQN